MMKPRTQSGSLRFAAISVLPPGFHSKEKQSQPEWLKKLFKRTSDNSDLGMPHLWIGNCPAKFIIQTLLCKDVFTKLPRVFTYKSV